MQAGFTQSPNTKCILLDARFSCSSIIIRDQPRQQQISTAQPRTVEHKTRDWPSRRNGEESNEVTRWCCCFYRLLQTRRFLFFAYSFFHSSPLEQDWCLSWFSPDGQADGQTRIATQIGSRSNWIDRHYRLSPQRDQNISLFSTAQCTTLPAITHNTKTSLFPSPAGEDSLENTNTSAGRKETVAKAPAVELPISDHSQST